MVSEPNLRDDLDQIYLSSLHIKKMNVMRIKDRLESASNFEAWKLRMLMILRKQKLTTMVENAPKSKKTDEWEADNIKAMEILVDAIKDYLLPIITKLDSAYDMFKALEVMFEINNTSRIVM